jgi:hypothetical protein
MDFVVVKLKIIVLYILITFSFLAFADTYPSITTTQYHAYSTYYTDLAAARDRVMTERGWYADVASGDYHVVENSTSTSVTMELRRYDNALIGSYTIQIVTSLTCPYGGTVSGSSCINAPSCNEGETRDSTGQCVSACPSAGTKKIIGIVSETKRSGGELVIGIGDDTAQKTAVVDGCGYTYTEADFQGTKCYSDPAEPLRADGSKNIYCEYELTATGSTSTAPPDADPTQSEKPSPSTDEPTPANGCVKDAKGNELCTSNPETTDPTTPCGKVNGVKVCPKSSSTEQAGTGTINGKPYDTSDKNCGYVNGKPVCVSTSGTTSTTTQGCVKNGAVVACVNSDIQEKTEQGPTTANPDGTTTQTTTTTSNEIGSGTVSTTTTTGTDGSVTTTTTGGTGKGDGKDSKTDCDKYPDSVGCASLGDVVGNEGGELTTETPDIGIDSNSSWGSGSCPSPKQLNLLISGGKSWSYQPVCDFMGYMRPVLISFGWLIAAGIVLY